MKGELTIKDHEYFEPLVAITQELDQAGIPYCIFGGGAVQIAMASLLTKGKTDMRKEPSLDEHLRKTGDIDILIDAPQDTLVAKLNELCEAYQDKHPRLEPGSLHFGKTVINYPTDPSDLKGFKDEIPRIFKTAQRTLLKRGNQVYNITIESPEYIIAAKLTGDSIKPKDEFDILHLSTVAEKSGKLINVKELKYILSRLGNPEKFDAYQRIINAYS